jgi:hypothetical protein
MPTTLSQQLEEYLAGWMQRVPADRRAAMERHIAYLSESAWVKSVAFRNGRPRLDFRSTPSATELARRCHMSRRAKMRPH